MTSASCSDSVRQGPDGIGRSAIWRVVTAPEGDFCLQTSVTFVGWRVLAREAKLGIHGEEAGGEAELGILSGEVELGQLGLHGGEAGAEAQHVCSQQYGRGGGGRQQETSSALYWLVLQ